MMDRQVIEEFARGGQKLAEAVHGLSPQDLLWTPPASANVGLWSIHQIVIHLMDSDLTCVHRMKRIIAEDNPLLIGYDETKFAQKLFYEQQSAQEAITILDLCRRNMASILRLLPAEAFERTGVHNERGKVRLGQLVGDYVNHLDHHLKFIAKKKELLGKRSR